MMIRNLVPTALLLVACAGAPAASSADVAAAAARLYSSRCSGCHEPYDPASRTREQWRTALKSMAPRAHLSAADQEAVGGWLAAGASDAPGGAR